MQGCHTCTDHGSTLFLPQLHAHHAPGQQTSHFGGQSRVVSEKVTQWTSFRHSACTCPWQRAGTHCAAARADGIGTTAAAGEAGPGVRAHQFALYVRACCVCPPEPACSSIHPRNTPPATGSAVCRAWACARVRYGPGRTAKRDRDALRVCELCRKRALYEKAPLVVFRTASRGRSVGPVEEP